MSVKHAILGLLADAPKHGYELKSAYEEELAPTAELNFGQVYATLERLEREGLATHERVDQTVRPARKVYSITPAGREELADWFSRPSRIELGLRNETFTKLMIARRRPGVDALGVLRTERRAFFERLHELKHAQAGTGPAQAGAPGDLLLQLAILKLEAFLEWLDRCEQVLRQESHHD